MEVKLFECPDQLTAKLTLQRLTRRNGISCCGRPGRRRPDSRVQAPPRAHRPAPDCRGRLRPRWSCGCSPTRWLGRYIPAGWSRESDTACPCHPDRDTAPGRPSDCAARGSRSPGYSRAGASGVGTWPLFHAPYVGDAGPGERFLADRDAVPNSLALRQDIIEIPIVGIDDDGAGHLLAVVVKDVPLICLGDRRLGVGCIGQ